MAQTYNGAVVLAGEHAGIQAKYCLFVEIWNYFQIDERNHSFEPWSTENITISYCKTQLQPVLSQNTVIDNMFVATIRTQRRCALLVGTFTAFCRISAVGQFVPDSPNKSSHNVYCNKKNESANLTSQLILSWKELRRNQIHTQSKGTGRIPRTVKTIKSI